MSSQNDWPQFRCDPAHTGAIGGFPPAPSGGFTEANDYFAIAGIINSSPAVVGGIAYCASDHAGVFAVDSNNQPLWVFQADTTGGGQAFGPNTEVPENSGVSYSSPAVVANGENLCVYIHADSGYLYCLNASDGTPAWATAYQTGQVSGPYQQNSDYLGRGFISSPVVSDGVVYVGSEDTNPQSDPHGGHLHCVDAASGTAKWGPFAVTGPVNSTPAVADGVVYFGSSDWVTPQGSGSGSSAQPVFVSPNNWIPSLSPQCWVSSLYCLDTTAANPALRLLASVPNGGVYSSPAVSEGVVYFATAGQPLGDSNGVAMYNGTLYALDAVTGAPKWLNPFTTNGYFVSSPAVSGSLVFAGTYNGDIGLFSGQELHNLFALNASDGTVAWAVVTDGWVVGSPAVAQGAGGAEDVVYACSSGGGVYVVGSSNGSVYWSAVLGGQIAASPAIAGGCVYVATQSVDFSDPAGNQLHQLSPVP